MKSDPIVEYGFKVLYNFQMAERRLGIYKNHHASREALKLVDSLRKAGALCIDTPKKLEELKVLPERMLVAGGDGSVGMVIQEMFNRREYRPLAILGGGTQNVLYNEHILNGQVMSVIDFIAASDEELAQFSFRPGIMGTSVFINQIGFGSYEQADGMLNQHLRPIPKSIRTFFVRGTALCIASLSDGRKIDIYSIVPRIGRVLAFPEQQLDTGISHGWIEDGKGGSRRMVGTLNSWRNIEGKGPNGPLPEFVKIEKGESFSVLTPRTIWKDGDTVSIIPGYFRIGRANFSVPVVALKLAE